MVLIRQVIEPQADLIVPLSELLIDVVHDGASVGFLAPLSVEAASAYWQQVFASLGENLALWIAESQNKVVGSAQLAPIQKQNGRHRAEVQKLFVSTSFRGQGIATQLMMAVEAAARADNRTLLVLDTQTGSVAELMYQRLGWQRGGEIPNYATTPTGELHPTTYYYKLI